MVEWLSDLHQSARNEEHNWEFTEDDLFDVEIESKKESRVCHLNMHQLSTSNEIIHKLVKDCSTLTKIERSLAYCFRFISNSRKKKEERILIRLNLP